MYGTWFDAYTEMSTWADFDDMRANGFTCLVEECALTASDIKVVSWRWF